jgi:hypothetical protein
MLAICSDLDATQDWRTYYEIARFLNTCEQTAFGPGVGLEVGNSIYFDMPKHEFAYWNTDDSGRAMIRDLIHSGHVDCLHSYGGLATTRAHAGKALEEFSRHQCHLAVWVDHSRSPTNFGPDIMCGHGDERGHEAYHADLTRSYGIQYVWRGRVTTVIGQGGSRGGIGRFARGHPIASGKAIAKEAVKRLLGRMGEERFRLQSQNAIVAPVTLRDGGQAIEFLRSNPHWSGPGGGATADGFPDVLSRQTLQRLLTSGGTSIVYTHLGIGRRPRGPFSPGTIDAFRGLAECHRAGNILVTTTRRLLDYWVTKSQVSVSAMGSGGKMQVRLSLQGGQAQRSWSAPQAVVAGLTVYVEDPERVDLLVEGVPVPVGRNPPDETGRASISIPWPKLQFPLG